jgi:predicted TPR repeat methyltransferase
MSRCTWAAVWAVLCVAGIAATAALNAFPASDPQPEKPEKPVSAECAEYIADIEAQLAKAKREGNDDGVLAFSRMRVGTDDCSDEVLDHFSGDR